MWIRIKETGSAEFVADLARAFELLDTGKAEAIDELPERSEVVESKPVEIRDGAKVHDPRPARKPKRG